MSRFPLPDLQRMDSAVQCGNVAKVQALLQQYPALIRYRHQRRSQSSWLHLAVTYGQDGLIRPLVRSGVPVDLRDRCGQTALLLAVKRQNRRAVKSLLELGADPSTISPRGDTPVFSAVDVQSDDILDELLIRRPVVDVRCNGETPLFRAAFHGHVGMAKVLLQAGADPLFTHADGRSVPDAARQNAHPVAARLLEDLLVDWVDMARAQKVIERISCIKPMPLAP